MDTEKTVLLLVEPIQLLVSGSFCQFAIETVGPAVIPASNDLSVSLTLLLNHWICTVSADIVKCVDVVLPVTDNDEVESRKFVAEPVAGLLDSRAVGHEKPSLGEYSTALQLVYLLGSVP